jgi:Lantibiotic dehydratase, N terminus
MGAGWRLWPVALLRGAGFAFDLLDTVLSDTTGTAARQIAGNEKFREALIWQNRSALIHDVDRLLRPCRQASRTRDRRSLRLIALYLQRYAAKNDTIGFFGPVGWATLSDDRGSFAPGPGLVAARRVAFEPWTLRAVFDALPEEQRLDAPLEIPGHLRHENGGLLGPSGRWPLTSAEARLVAAADGRTARAILADLASAGGPNTPGLTELRRLCAQGLLRWMFPVTVSHHPGAVASGAARAVVARFEAHRQTLQRSAGDCDRLATAIEALERDFTAMTDMPAKRHPGQTYAGRGLVYEDCRRDVSLSIGAAALSQFAPVMKLMGQLGRAYTFSVARDLAGDMLRSFRESGGAPVPLPWFWRRTAPLFEAEQPPAVARVASRLRADWRALFEAAETTAAGLSVSSADAEAFLLGRWSAASPGWPGARHHSPDLMWQAIDADAMLAGSGLPILAEFHPGVSTFTTLSVLGVCEHRPLMEQLWLEDFPEPLISPIPGEIFARSSQDARLAAKHYHLDTGGAFASGMEQAEVLKAAEFDVVEAEGRLYAASRARDLRFDLMAVFERRIKLRAGVGFPLGPGGAGGRLLIGGVVIRRATFVGVPPALPNNRYSEEARARLRSWRERLGCPQKAFCRLPSEVKPVYVDFASDLSVDMLMGMIRGSDPVVLSEMLPDRDGLWLRDRQARRYTSELRTTLVDPVPYDGAALWRAAAQSP